MVSALGLSGQETWDALLSGKKGISAITGFDPRGFNCRVAAQVKGLNPSELNIHPRDDRIMNTHSYLLLKSCREAYIQASVKKSKIPGEDVGFFVGMGMVDYEIDDLLPAVLKSKSSSGKIDYDAFYSRGYQEIFPLWPLSMLNNISFCQVSIDLGIKGENAVFSPHADSCLQAINEARQTLIEHKAKLVLAGGVSEKISPSSLSRASYFGLLNTSDTNGKATCLPFGEGRNGTVLGEGCGIITLELRSSAEARHALPLAAVTGYGSAFERERGHNAPTVRAISLAMEKALASAEIHASEIDLLVAHGDGTIIGDRNEAEAIHRVFTECLDEVVVYSSKGALGHTLAGAPAMDTILGMYILKKGIIPAVDDSLPEDKNFRFRLARGKPTEKTVQRIMVNARSFEGQCASLILETAD